MSKLMMNKYFIFAFLFFYINTSYAINTYVSDDISIHYRTGPSVKYRVLGTLTSGDNVTIINSTNSRFFYKIKTTSGKVGWVPKKSIKSCLSSKAQVKQLQQTVSSSVALIKRQADEIHRLKSLLNTQKVKNDNQSSKQTQLNTEISTLNSQINRLDDSNLIRWVTHVAIVLVFGIFLMAIVSVFRKRKGYNEIY